MTIQSFRTVCALVLLLGAAIGLEGHAGQAPDAQTDDRNQRVSPPYQQALTHFGGSPFAPPDASDTTFVVDQAPFLDTGCSYRSNGPLIFNINVSRFPGEIAKLKSAGLISPTAILRMPAWDVDYTGTPIPERDRVSFNGHVLTPEYITGANNTWKLNAYEIPIEWITFPTDPKDGGTLVPKPNPVRIDIDTANTQAQAWCTAIDWAALSITVDRPVLLVHGIFSSGKTWSQSWVPKLMERGVPTATINLGALDSISDNAAEIGGEVEALKKRWGIDSLNVVAHSKGGIDARHYAESSNGIASLVQIGTPNAGSPLADAAQASLLILTGVVGTALIDTLAAPAGIQLTTGYMQRYNAFHGHNPQTQYASLAGDYRFGGWGIVDAGLSAFYGGANDTIVSVSSVHALSYASHMTYQSTDSNLQARHMSQTASPDILAMLIKIASRGTQGTAPFITTGTADAPAAPAPMPRRTGTLAGTVRSGQTVRQLLRIDSCARAVVTLYHGTGDLGFTLITPTGRRVDPSQVSSTIDYVSYGESDGLRFKSYAINRPEAGLWTLEISGTTVVAPSGEEPYFASALLEGTSIDLEARLSRESYRVGQPLVILATPRDGSTPLRGVAVNAMIGSPDETTDTVALRDDGVGDDAVAGDGTYSGQFSRVSIPGLYRVVVTAISASPQMNRETLLVAAVSASQSRLNGAFAASGVDTDGNGLFDELLVQSGVSIASPARYRMYGLLTTPTGNEIATATAVADLAAGAPTMTLRFDGRQIFQAGADGPFDLKLVRLAEEGTVSVLPLDERADAFRTAAFRRNQFERPPILIAGTGTDRGQDTTGDGLFDSLRVSLDIDVLRGGAHNWTARLVDSKRTEIGFAAGSGTLVAGASTIVLVFDGVKIGQNDVDGPYAVDDLLVYGGVDSAVVFHAYTTAAYGAVEFAGNPGPSIASIQPASGPATGGTVVSLSGARFRPGSKMTFAGADATGVTLLDATRLQGVAAAHAAGPVDVSVTSGPRSATRANGFRYVTIGSSQQDSDADGMPDYWEGRFNLDLINPADASTDGDSDGRTNLQEFQAGTHPFGLATRYFAEGATGTLVEFDSVFALVNPDPALPTNVLLRFQKSDGSTVGHYVQIPPLSRRTVDAKMVDGLGTTAEFSTLIESDRPTIADRTMTWNRTGYGSHAETSVAGPSPVWYLAEGATHSGFDLFYLVQNPNPSAVNVEVSYLRQAGSTPLVKRYTVAANSRFNIWVNREDPALSQTDISAIVKSVTPNAPIIVERAMYLTTQGKVFGAGHESAGVSAPANQWFFAEGATGTFFDLFILVANPNDVDALVRADFLKPDGTTFTKTYPVARNSRFNIWVDQEDGSLTDTAVSTILTSTNGVPVIAERSMWWPGPTAPTWHEAHNSPGATASGTKWALAAGEVGGNASVQTYVLVANTSGYDGTAKVTLLYEDGGTAEKVFSLRANSRFNVSVADEFPTSSNRRFGTLVESLGSTPVQIIVERAMYSNAAGVVWAAGANSLGTRVQ